MLYRRELQILFRKRIVVLREEKPIDTSPVLDLKVFVSAEDFDVPKSFMPILDSRSIGVMARLRSFRSGDTDLARSEN